MTAQEPEPRSRDDRRKIETAVWSFWSAPYQSGYRARWLTHRDHLMCWALSWSTVSRFFDTTVLFTDSPGAHLLVNALQLAFDRVVTSLDDLSDVDSEWWTLGKLRAYRQPFPFVHFDSDAFLWAPLSDRLLTADIIAQNPEPAPLDDSSFYKPSLMSNTLRDTHGWAPEALSAYYHDGGDAAACTGIFGGCAWEDIAEYAITAERMIRAQVNGDAWSRLRDPFRISVFVEQYYLAAFCDSRTSKKSQPTYLFASQDESFSASAMLQRGFTHLISKAKRDARAIALVGKALEQRDPALHERCVRLDTSELHAALSVA